ncbi:hypothetical protein [Actinomadura geliboluensis]
MLAAADQHPWYAISWVDWLSVIGLPLTLAGFWLAYSQAKNAATKARDIEKAMKSTEQQIRERQLILLIPSLKTVPAQLGDAMASNNVPLARQYLDVWRSQVAHIRGIMAAMESVGAGIQKDIQQSIALSVTADSDLLRSLSGSADVYAICVNAHKRITKTCDALNTWLGQHSTGMSNQGRHS